MRVLFETQHGITQRSHEELLHLYEKLTCKPERCGDRGDGDTT